MSSGTMLRLHDRLHIFALILAFAGAASGATVTPRVLFLLLDGTRADVFYKLLAAGRLPNAKKHILDRGLKVDTCVSVFPSTTGPAYAPFITGLLPEKSNLPGIRWYDRTTGRSTVYAGREFGRINDDLSRDFKTIYELVPGDSASVFGYLDRGSAKSLMPVTTLAVHKLRGNHLGMDDALYGALAKHVLKADGLRRFMFMSFHAPDSVGHASGCSDPDYERSLEAIDRHIGKIADKLVELGAYDSTYIVVSADHGQSDADRHQSLAQLLQDRYGLSVRDSITRETFLHNLRQGTQRTGSDIHVEVSGNGCVQFYLAPAGADPTPRVSSKGARDFTARNSQRVDLERALVQAESVDLVMSRIEPGRYRIATARGVAELTRREGLYGYVVQSGEDPLGYATSAHAAALVGGQPATGDRWFEATADTEFPDAPVQIAQLLECPRAGDVIISAKPGWEPWTEGQAGLHGGLRRAHIQVPLLIAGPGVKRGTLARARTVDVFPTMCEMLGLPQQPGIDGRVLSWR